MDYLNIRKEILDQKNKIESNAASLKKLTDNLPGGIFQLKMNPEGELKFEFLSKGIQELHPNIDLSEWKKTPNVMESVIHPDDLPTVLDSFEESKKTIPCGIMNTAR